MARDVVLLVTASYDETASYVSRALDDLGAKYFRLDTDAFPFEITASIDEEGHFGFESPRGQIRDGEIKAVWYRRHVAPVLPSGLEDGVAEFCAREARACLEGIFHSIAHVRWVSDPLAVARAEKKPFQLGMAARLGFRVPPTIISNQPSRVREFANGRQVVAKAVSSGYVQAPEGNRAIFTSVVPDTDFEDLDGLRLAPVIFQELIPKSRDIRVTVVGQQVFAAEILSQERASSRIDWRATDDPNLEHRPHVLPESVGAACIYLVRELGLRFGAIDLALTTAGDYVFFEINPNGEWAWIEDQCGYPIAHTIALFLAKGVR